MSKHRDIINGLVGIGAVVLVGLATVEASAEPETNAYVSLAWTMPTNNADGTVLADLAGAKIYYGTASSNYTQVVDVGLTNTMQITGLEVGTLYYFTGTAYNTAGLESGYCNEVAKRISRPSLLIKFHIEASGTIRVIEE